MKERVVNIAAVGTGGIWNAHATNLSLLGDNKIVAICEINEARRREVVAATGARGYAGIEEMLARETEIDAIVSCTPPTVRREVIEAAAARQIPVFVEKPPAASLVDAGAIAHSIEASGVPVAVGFMYRYFPAIDRMRELIGAEPVNLVQSSMCCPAATKWNIPPWFYIKERSGGHILDQAIHIIDLLRYIAGDIVQVHTYGNNVLCPKREDFTVEDSSSTILRFASGASGCHIHSWAHSKFDVFMTVIGREFRLTLEFDSHLTGFVGDQVIDETFPSPPAGASHHFEEMRAFLQAVRTADFELIRSPFADASKSLATVLAMNESIDSGTAIDVPRLPSLRTE